jgi:hypothetical protein
MKTETFEFGKQSDRDEVALVLDKLIATSRTLRYLDVAGKTFQAAGVAALKAAAIKKTTCLFETSGLESSESRKRTVPESSEDSNEELPRSNDLLPLPVIHLKMEISVLLKIRALQAARMRPSQLQPAVTVLLAPAMTRTKVLPAARTMDQAVVPTPANKQPVDDNALVWVANAVCACT